MGKNNYYLKNIKEGTKVESYSIKKFKVGAASVVIGASIFFGAGAVAQASESVSNNTTTDESLGTDNKLEVAPKAQAKPVVENTRESVAAAVASKLENSEKETLNKTTLTKLIEEIDGKFTVGKYASKTEDSVQQLKVALEEARTVLNNAKTQAELTKAHAKLVTATTKLQTKPEEKKEAPAVDTTNGKATVGKTATNTEKAADTNSIANSGSRDERNGKALDNNNPFRTEAATTNDDPAANQTYTAPAENADLNELKSELLKLPDAVQNNTKIQDMNDLGDKTGVARGDVKEIQEFGGWKAINQPDGTPGKFAIARKTESGIFPVETVNTVFTNIRNGQARYYDTYVGEQAFDRSKDYMLFLGKVRTIASENEQTFNGKPYSRTGLGGSDSYAIKSFSGIEKTFKAHSPETGSKVKVAFKTGFTGDLNGTKAKYLVEVVYRQNDSEVTAYTYTFAPQPTATVKNDKGIVTPAKDGTGRAYVRSEFNNYTLNKAEVEAKMAEEANKPNGQAGTFTSSDIDLPVGVTEYTVRIKVTDTDRMGMGYQSPLRHYALPVTGLDFSVEQDTRKLAKNLLQRVYDKLKATEAQDIKGKTDETISAYKEQLKNVENLLAGDLKNTQEYKDIVTAVLDGQKALRTDKSKLKASNNNLLGLINEDPDPRIGKTPISKEPYNTAKDEAVKAQTEAQTILAQENPDPDVVAAAVSKLNEKLAELKAARAELVVAATEAQKTKLEESAAKLVKASTDGKTQDSINEYETTYNNLKTELDKAIEAAAAIKTAGDNASEYAALKAQEAVDAVQAKLDAAKATLVDKATEEQKAELRKAEAALTPAEESTLAGAKTPASIAEYKKAVDAIQSQLTEAKATASDLVTKAGQNNAKKVDAAEAIAKVDALKAKLAEATALLKDKANTGDLATAKDELKALAGVENVTDGKTTATKDAYDAAKREADAAVTAAEGIINNADSTPEQVAEALTNVKAKKAELEKAKAALVDKATEAQKTKLEESAAKLVKASTDGKTQDSINEYETTYNNLKTELDKAIEAAAAIKTAGDNASKLEALAAQEAVDAVLAKLEAAKATLVDKATEEQKAELAKAEAALTPAEESTLAGTKTPASIAAYKKAVDAIQSQLTEAKATASDLVTKAGQNNAKKVDAAEAIAKVDALKAKLAEATALLKDKANTGDLATAKDELKALAGVENVTDGKTTSTKDAYDAAKRDADAAVTAAEGIINNADSTPEQVAEALTNVKAKKAELEKAKAALVDKATEAQKTKLEESAAKLVKADTAGKTQESIDAYETTYNNLKTELDKAIEAAAAIKTAGDNASEYAALKAQEAVDAVQAKLDAAKATLVDKATEEQKAELRKAEAALTPAEESTLAGAKTPASIAEYKKAVDAIQSQLTEAKATASDLVTKAGQNNAKKVDAAEAIAKVDALKAKLAEATALLKDKANTGDLATAKDELKALAGVENVTDGKTTSTKDAYDAAKRDADAAVTAAEGIINNADSTPEQVAEALTNVKAKKAELEKAKAALVDKATEAQKTKLEESAAKLVKADTAGKTQESIDAYETTYNNLKTELDKAIEAAAAIKTAGDNASKLEALAAQEAVDAVLAKLEAAKATLVDKATEEQKAELAKAEAALTPVEGSTFEATKTPKSIAAYKKAVDAIQSQLTEAKATASDLVTKAGQNNAKKVDAAEAIAKVDALKAKLAEATALLKDKANTGDLATAKDELKALAGVENVTDGKTTATKDAYDAAKREADAAVTAAEGIINNADSTPEQVAEALTNVKAKKAELEKAKAALVDKATEAQKTKLEESAAKLVKADTAGKTQESIDAYETTYNNLKTELDKAIEAAAAIKTAGDNASKLEALAAQEAVDAVLAKLEAAKATLVDKATEEQKAELAKAEAALTPAEESTLAGTKTPASIAAYKKAVDAIQSQLTEAKATASDLVTKAGQNNATKAEAAEAIAKVDALKAKIAEATALLKDKANTGDLATAKDELKALAGVENVTDGKTTSTKDAYDAAKRDADAAVTEAEGIINNADSTPEQVAEALTNVKAKKAELEKAKAALVDKITQDQKDDLANAEENLKLADTTGKAKDSVKAYNDEVTKLSDELAAAKQAAKDLVDKGDNAGELEAYRVQAKINKLKSKLAEAAKLLKDIDKSAAKKEVEDAAKKATDAIVANNDLTPEQKEAAKAKVAEEATKAIDAIDKATTEDAVTTATDAGKLGIEKEAAKAEIEAAKSAKEKAIEVNEELTPEQKAAAKAKVAEEATKANAEIDKATTKDGVTSATDAGKLGIEKEAAKAEIEAAKSAKEKAIEANAELTPEQKAAAKAKVAEEATKANAEIDKATTKDGVTSATDAGKLGIEKEAAKAEIEAAKAAKEKAIEANEELTPEQKAVAKAKVAEEATKATDAIDKATTKEGVTSATDAGKLGIEKEAAKAEIEAAKAAKEKAIEANADLTPEQKAAAKAKVAEEATKATDAIDKATTKDGVTKATDAGKLGIEKEAAKAEIEAAKAAKEKAIEANAELTPEQKAAAKAKVAEEATKATDAIDKATTKDGVTTATDAGKLGIEKEAAKAEIEAAKAAKEKAIEANDKLSDSEKQAAKEEANKAADEAKKAIDAATDNAGVNGAKTTGTAAVKAVNPVGKEKALDAIQKATEDKLAEIDRDDKLSDKEKDKAKAEVAKAAIDAVNAINAATNQAAVDAKQTEGTKAVSEVNPVGKDKAKAEIEKELAEKTKAIDSNPDLTDAQKAEAKAKLVEEAKKAIDAIDKATTTEDVAAAKESGKLAIEKEAAKAEIEAAKAAKDKTIDANPDLTEDEKAEAKARVEEEAEAAKNAIDKATELSDIDKVTETGKDDIKKVTVTSAKEEAKKAIDEALAAKEKAIDARTDLTQEEKEAAKEAAREEAEAAKNAIDKATTSEDINKVLEDGKENIAKINPENLKDKAKKAIDEALAAKEKAIDARTDLTQEEKEAAKEAAREEAEAAKNAIDKATTSEDINKVLEDGKENIAKINPENLKDKAKKAIDEALAAKEKAIDARTDLLPEEKEAAKKAAREEAEAAKNAIDKATTSEDINKVLEDGKENIAKINPVGAKAEAKKAVEEALANKEKEIDARTDLTPEEKVKAKELAREEAKAAKDAIDKATSIEGIEKALRPFLYQIDQDALVFDLPTLDIKEALKSLVQGIVSIEQGKQISDQDVLSKLNLPEGLEVVKIEKPATTALGATSAKVTIKLSDGNYATVEVPVEVVKKSIDNSKDSEDKVRVDKTTENTNREENRSSVSKEDLKTPKNTLPNTGTTETNTGLAGLGLGILGVFLAAARRRKEK